MTQALDWLCEPSDPGVRFLALRDLVGLDAEDPEFVSAQAEAHLKGPIHTILEAMNAEGYWSKPGPGYNPKYRSTVWSLTLLAQLGASVHLDERIPRACGYLLDRSLTANGQFSTNGSPSHTIDCLQGNLCAALVLLGYEDERIGEAYEWMARSVTGEEIAPAVERDAPLRYYAYKCGPNFACGVNEKQPCGWGAVKVMLAFGALPEKQRTPLIERAINQGVDFLFSVDPVTAGYPCSQGKKPSSSWWKFGFPVFYVTDILQIAEVLVRLGCGSDPRLGNTLDLIRQKQDENGRWDLEYEYKGKTWVDFGLKKESNKWVTLRALRVLNKERK